MTRLPSARGPLSAAVIDALRSGSPLVGHPRPSGNADETLALWVLHEMYYRGFAEVADDQEWRPDLLSVRLWLEQRLESGWRERATDLVERALARVEAGADLPTAFFELCEHDAGPSLARFVQRRANVEQVITILRQRSIYHGKEQDPAMWTLPRLDDRTKAHLVAIAADEYGNGRPAQLHAHWWAEAMEASGSDPGYGAHVDEALPEVLEQNNLMTMLGLNRRLVGAALGHLAAFEATSAVPSRRMLRGLERLDMPEPLLHYYREHMTADAAHEQVAVRLLLGSHLDARPGSLPDVVWGAAVCVLAEAETARAVLARVGADSRKGEAA